MTSSLDEFYKQRHLKKFVYVNEQGKSFLMTEEDIRKQKEIEQSVKADATKDEIKKGKKELIYLLGLEVVERMYKDKVKYDKYCNKMLNRRAQGKITNCDVLSRGKGSHYTKIMDDGSDEIIQNFKAIDLHLRE
nr:hypothetical protein [Tanacetum cinerariifolium]